MSTIGTIRRTSPAMKPIVWSWPKVHRARKPCHAASHRNGPVSSRIAGRQLAGKRSANDSNIESPSGGVEVGENSKRRGGGEEEWCFALSLPNQLGPPERGNLRVGRGSPQP